MMILVLQMLKNPIGVRGRPGIIKNHIERIKINSKLWNIEDEDLSVSYNLIIEKVY